MITIELIFLGFLILVSILDILFRKMPSVFLTAFLIALIVLKSENLYFAMISGLFALLFYEFDFLQGIADIKVLIMLGFFTTVLWQVFLVAVLTILYGFVWIAIIKLKAPQKYKDGTPFIPVFFFIYLTLLFI